MREVLAEGLSKCMQSTWLNRPDQDDVFDQTCEPDIQNMNIQSDAKADPGDMILVALSPEAYAFFAQQRIAFASLEARLSRLEKAASNKSREDQDSRDNEDCDPKLEDIVQVTQEIFGDPIEVETYADPEVPGNHYVVFNVKAIGAPQEIVKKRGEWHERILQLKPGNSGLLKLSITPK